MAWDKTPLEWEQIDFVESWDGGPSVVTERAPIPGGWLVRCICYSATGPGRGGSGDPTRGVSITFVPTETSVTVTLEERAE